MIVPGRLTLRLAAALALVLLAAVAEPRIIPLVLAADLALLVACLLQGRRLRRAAVEVSRRSIGNLQQGRLESLAYQIINRSPRPVHVRIRQPWPPEMNADGPNTAAVRVAANEVVVLTLQATPTARGPVDLPAAEVDVQGSIDLARDRRTLAAASARAFPTMRGLSRYEALRRHHAAQQAAMHVRRRPGAGREFDQLRDYVPDDDFRSINWKATARHNRLVATVYRDERGQDVLLCLDCGRMMGNPLQQGGVALDAAVDAAVLLAHVANRQGDRIGLALFHDSVERFVKPMAGTAAVNRVIEALVDARPHSTFPSYAALLATLRVRQNRRAMLFIFTDVNDMQLAANLAELLPLLSQRHLVVVVSLRDPQLEQIAAGPATGANAVYDVLAARQLSTERAARVADLRRSGATVLEADAGSLTTQLLNAYLSIKTRQLL